MTARPGVAIAAAAVLLPLLLTAAVTGAVTAVLSAPVVDPSGASPAAVADIPADYLALYREAADTCPGLDWSVLAAIGKTETDHGRAPLPGVRSGQNTAGAGGPMRIVPSTWDTIVARHRIPPGGAQPPSRYNPHDAVHAAAFYLCDNGAPDDLRAAIFAYNHSTAYVDDVLARAASYRQNAKTTTRWAPEAATVTDPSGTGGTGGGRITARMKRLYQALAAAGATSGGATCWDPHPQNPASDHPRGKACDIFFNPHNPADVARGWQVAQWLARTQTASGVHYLIWQGQIWTAASPTWTTYHSRIYGCPDPNNLTGCHYDHIHISVY